MTGKPLGEAPTTTSDKAILFTVSHFRYTLLHFCQTSLYNGGCDTLLLH